MFMLTTFCFCFYQELALASEQLVELEKFKQEIEVKLKEHQTVEQQKADLERHVQALIKVTGMENPSVEQSPS